MPPQTPTGPQQPTNPAPPTATPPAQPAPPAPKSQFDFILKDPNQKPKGKFGLPANLPLPAMLIVFLVPLVIIVLLLALLFGGGPTSGSKVSDLYAQNLEIVRVSNAYIKDFNDTSNANVVSTTVITLTGQQTQFTNYLAKVKYKSQKGEFGKYLDKKTDASLQTAVQTNSFDKTFMAYLDSALQKYQNSIQADAKGSSQNVIKFLNTAYKSNKVLLSSPQFASNNPS